MSDLSHIREIFQRGFKSPFLWIALAGIAVYFRTLFYGYTFDDAQLIVNSRHYLKDWHNILGAFTRNPYWNINLSYYRPILTLSFMLDFLWAGIVPFFYHLSNIIYHLVASCLFFAVLRKLDIGRKAAACWALAFTIHPLFSQAVAWIPGRNDSLLAIFSLASFAMLMEYSEKKGKARFVLQLIFLALALLTKETAAVLPAIFFCYLFCAGARRPPQKISVLLILSWFLVAAAYFTVRSMIFGRTGIHFYSLKDSLIGLMSYLGKTVFPVNLSVMPVDTDINIYYGLAVVLIFGSAAVLLGIRNKKMFWFGISWMVLLLLPTFVQITDFPHFLEHRFYLPAAGIPIFVSQVDFRKALKYLKDPIPSVLCWSMILILGTVNIIHSRAFYDGKSFWENAVKTSPHSYFVHYMLGLVHFRQNELDRAEAEFNRALQIKERSKWAYDNLAMIHEIRGQYAEAEDDYKKAVKLFPEDPVMHNNYGTFLLNQKRWEQAGKEFQTARELITDQTRPQDCGAVYYNLALIDVMNSRLGSARENLMTSLAYSKYDYKTLELLANVSFQTGDPVQAAQYYDSAIKHGLVPNRQVMEILAPYFPSKR